MEYHNLLNLTMQEEDAKMKFLFFLFDMLLNDI